MDPRHTGRLLYFQRDVWLPRVIQQRGIRNLLPRHDFRHCVIHGPAVVLLIDSELNDCRVAGSLQMLPWDRLVADDFDEVPPDGVIRIYGCSFDDCLFDGIGFAAPPDRAPALEDLLTVDAEADRPGDRHRRATTMAG
jgi:hypothetical protein